MKTTTYVILILLSPFIFFSCQTQKHVNWKQYDLITNIDELIEFFPGLNLDRGSMYEKAEISKFIDGSKELVYEYEMLEPGRYDQLFYSITVEIGSNKKQAREAYNLTKTALIGGSMLGDAELQKVDIDLPGDQNYYAIRTIDGEPNGHLFIARKGLNVYSLIVSGLYTSDHSLMTNLIGPEIESLGEFTLDVK